MDYKDKIREEAEKLINLVAEAEPTAGEDFPSFIRDIAGGLLGAANVNAMGGCPLCQN